LPNRARDDLDDLFNGVILSAAVLQAERRISREYAFVCGRSLTLLNCAGVSG
jgi:hypothetical protein